MSVSVLSGKIQVMKSMPWPIAVVVATAILVIGALALFERDVSAVSNAILMLLVALGYAELREIKSNTNGTNTKMLEELSEYRRTQARITDRALESQPLTPPEER